jgi:hypothetical protein
MFMKHTSAIQNTLIALSVMCALPLLSQQANAAAPAIVKEINSIAGVSVQVPAGGTDAKYYFGAKKIIIPAGTSAPLPVGAVRIFLPRERSS